MTLEIDGMSAEITEETLACDKFDLQFDEGFMIQFSRDGDKWVATNAMDGYGFNCRKQFEYLPVTITE